MILKKENGVCSTELSLYGALQLVEDMDPRESISASGYGPPGPNPLADMDRGESIFASEFGAPNKSDHTLLSYSWSRKRIKEKMI